MKWIVCIVQICGSEVLMRTKISHHLWTKSVKRANNKCKSNVIAERIRVPRPNSQSDCSEQWNHLTRRISQIRILSEVNNPRRGKQEEEQEEVKAISICECFVDFCSWFCFYMYINEFCCQFNVSKIVKLQTVHTHVVFALFGFWFLDKSQCCHHRNSTLIKVRSPHTYAKYVDA